MSENTSAERWTMVQLVLIIGSLIAFVVCTNWLAAEMGWETSDGSSYRRSSSSSPGSSGSRGRGGGASGGGGGGMR